jgi:hypothetical protein
LALEKKASGPTFTPVDLVVLVRCSVVRRLAHSEDFPLLRSVPLLFVITARREPFHRNWLQN